MKRLTVLLILVIGLCTINTGAQTFSLTLGYGIRQIAEKELAEVVYGTDNPVYAIDMGLFLKPFLQVFFHTDYFSVDGETTFTKEPTTLEIIPIEIGARFLLGKRIQPYLGVGPGYYMVKEEHPIGTIDEKKIGFFVEGGLRLHILKPVFIDLKLKNIFLKVDFPEADPPTTIDLGGLSYIGGIGISF